MRRFTSIAAAVAFMPGAAGLGGSAQAGPMPIAGAKMTGSEALPLEEVQFVWGGRNYCWYSNGWQGPGWYWCGYRWLVAMVGAAAMAGTGGAIQAELVATAAGRAAADMVAAAKGAAAKAAAVKAAAVKVAAVKASADIVAAVKASAAKVAAAKVAARRVTDIGGLPISSPQL
jgi:hypothetical protein